MVPKAYQDRPFRYLKLVAPRECQNKRIGWDDFKIDYTAFSDTLSDEEISRNHYWMMVGPTGPRRLRLAIEHLANVRAARVTSLI